MPIAPPNSIPSPPGLAVSSQDIILRSLRLINVIATGETMDGNAANDALAVLNQMIDSWNANRLLIFTVQRLTQDAAGNPFYINGKQTYTMGGPGIGADFNVARPPKIDRVGVINLNNPTQPLELPMDYLTDAQWQAVPVKNIQSALPQYVWDDQNFPLRGINFWPIPNVQCIFVAYVWSQLTFFQDLGNTLYSFPPAYLRAIQYNLAVELAPEYGAHALAALATVAPLAAQSKAEIENLNAPMLDLRCDSALVNSRKSLYNWLTDQPATR